MDPKKRMEIAMDIFLRNKAVVNSDNLYKPRAGDIFVVGPVKSGTTWMQQILHQIRTKGDENFDDIYDVSWWMPNPKMQGGDFDMNGEQGCNPRLYKHHEAYGIIPSTNEQKHIVIIRNPYDAAFSWQKFLGRFYGDENDLDVDELVRQLEEMHEANIAASFRLIPTWWQHRNDKNVLFVFYEDLLKDLRKVIVKIANFVEIPLTDNEVDYVTSMCTFEYMTKHKEKFQGETVVDFVSKTSNIETWTPKMGMIREDGGKAGQGKRNLAPKVKSTVDNLWKENVANVIGYTTYEDMYTQNTLFINPAG